MTGNTTLAPTVILAPGRMGDMVTAEPIFRQAHLEAPDRPMILVTRPAYADIYRACPFISRIICKESKEEIQTVTSEFPAGTRFIYINLGGGAGPCPKPEPAKTYPLDRLKDRTPSLLTQFQRANGLPETDDTPCFYLDESVRLPEGLPEKYVVFHCSSQGKSRQWPPARFRQLAEICFARDIAVVEIGFDPVMKMDHPLYFPLCGNPDLHYSARIIRHAMALVGVESGMLHIANAFRIPGFILTGKLRQNPWYNHYCGGYRTGENANLLRMYNVNPLELPLEPVAYALNRFLDGDPMGRVECDVFCLKYQLEQLQNKWYMRLIRSLSRPFFLLRERQIFHQRGRRK